MSDNTNPDDGVEIPEAAPEDFGSQQARRGLSPATKFGIVIGGVFLIIGASVMIGGSEVADPTSSISVDADLDGTPGGAIQSESPRYQELLEASNDEAAQEAAEQGRTFIPTPERILRPIEDLEAGQRIEDEVVEVVEEPDPIVVEPRPAPVVVVAPPAPPVAARPTPTTTAPTTTEQQENSFTSAMLSQMGAISGSNPRPNLNIQTTGIAERNETESEAITADDVVSDQFAPDAFSPEVLIPAGEIMYAETLTSTNSDLEGTPVLIELTTGEYRGSRLIGSFAVNEASDNMVIQFTSLTTEDGDTFEINAFAVDGITAEGAVASDVERRYLSRYGPILASAFISSYAEARSTAEQTLASVGDETVVLSGTQTVEQSLYAGLGSAAEAIGSDLVANAPNGPKVILRHGYPLAVIFTTSMVSGE